MQANRVEGIIVQYGVPNEHGDILTQQAALELFEQLLEQKNTSSEQDDIYHMSNLRMDGDEKQGTISATLEKI